MKSLLILVLSSIPLIVSGQSVSPPLEIGIVYSKNQSTKKANNSSFNYTHSTSFGLELSTNWNKAGFKLALLYSRKIMGSPNILFFDPLLQEPIIPHFVSLELPVSGRYFITKTSAPVRLYTGLGASLQYWYIINADFLDNKDGHTVKISGSLGSVIPLFSPFLLEFEAIYWRNLLAERRINIDSLESLGLQLKLKYQF